ncbi:MAG: MBOAT family O-acyltransferase [Draconibacterium sp.]
MLFNSVGFILFLTLVFFLYWGIFAKNITRRNVFLLVISYFFYSCWDVRFLGLIVLSSLVDYTCGIQITQTDDRKRKKRFLWLSILVNLGILGFFKYFGFFAEELNLLVQQFGYKLHPFTLNIVLPVGISFYTFQTLSYTIDVYKGKTQATRDVISFFAFVAFFPQLVAGPIERASHLLPQFHEKKSFDYPTAAEGFRRILWGLFAKVAVADTVAPLVDQVFSHSGSAGWGTLLLGAFLFSIQIYGDFSGYSNIAIGSAALLGFRLMDNFRNPYFSRNLQEFWSRWHISLSSWFRDYVYIPLGGNRCSKPRYIRNILITFGVSGLWHGANWTFIVWGMLHGFAYLLSKPFTGAKHRKAARGKDLLWVAVTFLVVSFLFVIFRAKNISEAFHYLSNIILLKAGDVDMFVLANPKQWLEAAFFTFVLIVAEWKQRQKSFALDISESSVWVRSASYYLLLFSVLYAFTSDRLFIYFQF